jgi:hypothetical protein
MISSAATLQKSAEYKHRWSLLSLFARYKPASLPGSGVVDTPTALDLLGYEGFARVIASRILSLHLDETPLTVGVFGEWGSGKTSFLKMVDAALSDVQLRPIWFQAWKYCGGSGFLDSGIS